jgi:hypothetical protein
VCSSFLWFLTRQAEKTVRYIKKVKLTGYEVKTPLVIRNKFDLTCKEVNTSRRFGLICMADIQKALSLDPTPPFLPDPPHLPFRFLQKMASTSHTMLFITL